LSPVILALGTISFLLSGALRTVVKIPISATEPIVPPAMIKSPILNGLKINIKTPAAKLDNEPCSAKPTAKPAAPSTAIKEVV